jgi:hypothetical protein
MSTKRHTAHEVVELLTSSGRWPAGTVGTVVEANDELALIEITDDRGRALDFVSIRHGELASADAHAVSSTLS